MERQDNIKEDSGGLHHNSYAFIFCYSYILVTLTHMDVHDQPRATQMPLEI